MTRLLILIISVLALAVLLACTEPPGDLQWQGQDYASIQTREAQKATAEIEATMTAEAER